VESILNEGSRKLRTFYSDGQSLSATLESMKQMRTELQDSGNKLTPEQEERLQHYAKLVEETGQTQVVASGVQVSREGVGGSATNYNAVVVCGLSERGFKEKDQLQATEMWIKVHFNMSLISSCWDGSLELPPITPLCEGYHRERWHNIHSTAVSALLQQLQGIIFHCHMPLWHIGTYRSFTSSIVVECSHA
jgi:hypothetical protein